MLKMGGLSRSRRLATRVLVAVGLIAGAGGGFAAMLPVTPASAAVGTTPSTVNITSSKSDPNNPPVYGDQITFTVSVTGSGATPTGTVTFSYTNGYNGSTVFQVTCGGAGSVNLNTGTASCIPDTALLAGPDTVSATYSGDPTYAGGNGSVAQQVNPQPTTIAITSSPASATNYGQAAAFTATITPQPPAAYQPSTNVLPLGGSANFNANGNHLADCVNVPVAHSSPYTSTCTTHDLPRATDSVTAFYNSDGNYASSLSPGVAQTVNKAGTTTSVSPPASTSNYTQQVTITATVTPTNAGVSGPTGTVGFAAGGSNLPDCSGANAPTLTGIGTPPAPPFTATCNTKDLPGTAGVAGETVTATYSGDGNYSTSSGSSNTNGYVVHPASTTVSTPTSNSNPGAVGQPVTYSAAVTPSAGTANPSGTMSFSDNGSAIPSCSGANARTVSTGPAGTTATCTVTYGSKGMHSITAIYNGDSNYAPSSPSGALSENVNTIPSTTTIAGNGPSPSTYGQSVSFTATVTPSSGSAPTGTVTFADGGTAICSNVPVSPSGKNATASCATNALGAGKHTITATYSGDGSYSQSTSAAGASQTVDQAPTTTSLTSTVSAAAAGQTFTATVTPNSPVPTSPTGSVAFADNQAPIAGCAAQPLGADGTATCSVGNLSVGNHSISATYSGDTNFVGSASAQNQLVQAHGYWIVGADGGVFNFGPGAGYFGSHGGSHLNSPVVGMAATPDGRGYWLVASDGGIFNYGDAGFFGSHGGSHLNSPVVGMAATPDGRGYWLVASDGGIFN
ncbi:MAG TPA: Ig-like domain-containing protein, partial [Acidimicrobiales bacterium]